VATNASALEIKATLGEAWIPRIYTARILKLRTRSYEFSSLRPASRVAIQHTLLGVELKVGNKRLLCPDLATARYLSVFAKAGCKDLAVPYDITKVSRLADELESSWYRMLLLVDEDARNKSKTFRSKLLGLLLANIRSEVAAAGAGAKMPEFRQETRQRKG